MLKINRFLAVLLLMGIMAGLFPAVSHSAEDKHEYTTEEIHKIIDGIVDWKKSDGNMNDGIMFNKDFLQNAGNTSADWYAFALGRLGYTDDYLAYLAIITDNVTRRYGQPGKLDADKATEWHRIALSILSIGGDPTIVAADKNKDTINLIADGTYNRGKIISLGNQGINGWTWGLVLLDSLNYKIPEDAYYTRKDIIEEILSLQLTDGGFALQAENCDPDITAMTIQALAPYYNSEEVFTYTQDVTGKTRNKKVRDVVDEALEELSVKQQEDGDYLSWGSKNSESTAQVLTALCTLGINPREDERFIKNGNTLLDALMKYRMSDGGFVHSKDYDEENPSSQPDESNSMASEQVLYALTALCRYDLGMRSLYDFKEEMNVHLAGQVKNTMDEINMIPEKVTDKNKTMINNIFMDYQKIPVYERRYVFNYKKLADAMKKLGAENKSEPFTNKIGINTNGKGTVTSIWKGNNIDTGKIIFTEDDSLKVQNIDDLLGTENYVDVTKFLYKLNNADNKEQYESLLTLLQGKKDKINKIQDNIEKLNNQIIDDLHPFSEVSIKDKQKVDGIIAQFDALSEYDRKMITEYEDVIKSKTKIDNQVRAIIISLIAVLVVLFTLIIIWKRVRKRKRKRMEKRMTLLEDEEE